MNTSLLYVTLPLAFQDEPTGIEAAFKAENILVITDMREWPNQSAIIMAGVPGYTAIALSRVGILAKLADAYAMLEGK